MKKALLIVFTWNNFLVASIGASIGFHIVQFRTNKSQKQFNREVVKSLNDKSELIHEIIQLDSVQVDKIVKLTEAHNNKQQ